MIKILGKAYACEVCSAVIVGEAVVTPEKIDLITGETYSYKILCKKCWLEPPEGLGSIGDQK